jgi:hypothetical protein
LQREVRRRALVSESISLKGGIGIGVTELNDLPEIPRQEGGNRTGLLILVDVAELVRE